MRHARFFARTILVKNNDVDGAFRLLNKTLTNENILQEARQKQRFEPPCKKRRRICHERCVRIYNSEMSRKIDMLMKKNRTDPWPR